jgi:hypothetical protein
MGATLKYVKDFDFSPKAYAKGGKVCGCNKAVAPARRSVPVAPVGPLIALKKGGKVGKC